MQAIGIGAPFDVRRVEFGSRRSIVLRGFRAGVLTLGRVVRSFDKSKQRVSSLLVKLGILIADYDL